MKVRDDPSVTFLFENGGLRSKHVNCRAVVRAPRFRLLDDHREVATDTLAALQHLPAGALRERDIGRQMMSGVLVLGLLDMTALVNLYRRAEK